MKVRAAVLNAMGATMPYAKSKPLSIEEVELRPPGPGEVLVRMGAAGLCHSDLSMLNNEWGMSGYPFVGGHEVVGTVIAASAGEARRGRRSRRPRLELRQLLVVRPVPLG